MKRKIAIISDHASPLASALGGADGGGQNVYVAQIARHLAALGYEADVFTRRDDAALPEIVSFGDRARVVHVPAGPPRFVRKEDLFDLMPEFGSWLVRFFGRHRYDLVHANFFLSGIAAMELKKSQGVPFVVTFHALGRVRRIHQKSADEFPDARFAVEEKIAAEADRVIAECPQDETDLTELYRAAPEIVTIAPCGFDEREMYPIDKRYARRRLGLEPEDLVILQLGRIVPRKGIETVVRATAELVKRRGLQVKLLIVGGETRRPDPEKTPEIGRLRRVAEECGAAGNVFFVGNRRRDELKYFYSAADVFASVPWYEPFGITPLEAMACAAPVVGANVGGIKYTVADGETGFLVEPKNEFALAEKIERLLKDENLREQFGRNGLARVRRHFTWRAATTQIAAVYEDVLEKRAPRTRATVAATAAKAPPRVLEVERPI
jgi:D-inositol-3-phosphate glycosyltransferase